MRGDIVWQDANLVNTFLSGVRGAIPFASEQINLVLTLLDHTGRPMTHLADLGCGDGVLTQALLVRYPQAQVTALDFSAPMLEQAKQRLHPFGDRVQLIQADLYTPDWQTHLQPFDAIISGYCIHHLPDDRKRMLYQEIYHQLSPGGGFFNIEHVASATPWGEHLFNEVLTDCIHQWQQSQGQALSRQEVAEQFVHRPDKQANILASVEAQCQWLREIGFERVDCYFKFLELAVFGGIRPS